MMLLSCRAQSELVRVVQPKHFLAILFPAPHLARTDIPGHGPIPGKYLVGAQSGKMNDRKQHSSLAFGEYISRDQFQNTEIAGARLEFMEVVRRVFPRFLEQLREGVYPNYARLVENRPGYWETGWTLETWQLLSDPDRQLTPCLVEWAGKFNSTPLTKHGFSKGRFRRCGGGTDVQSGGNPSIFKVSTLAAVSTP